MELLVHSAALELRTATHEAVKAHVARMSAHGDLVLVFLGLDEDALPLRDARVLVRVVVDEGSPHQAPEDAGGAEEVEDRLPAET